MKYQSKPYQCEAFKIVGVGAPIQAKDHMDGGIPIALDDGTSIVLEPGQVSRMTPSEGDYYVVATNPDGKPYPYLNPKAVFESKYEPVPEIITAGHELGADY